MNAPHFTPVFGRKTRQFERMWQAVRYSSGYSAQQMGTAEHQTYTDKHYQLGVADAREDATVMTFTQYLARRQEALKGKAFDQLLEGACK